MGVFYKLARVTGHYYSYESPLQLPCLLSAPIRILSTKEDVLLAADLESHLVKCGFASRSTRCCGAHKVQNFDLILEDIMLPGSHDFEVLTRLRRQKRVPVS